MVTDGRDGNVGCANLVIDGFTDDGDEGDDGHGCEGGDKLRMALMVEGRKPRRGVGGK